MEFKNVKHTKLNENIEIYILDIIELESSLENILNKHFVKICKGNVDKKLPIIKNKFRKYLENKGESHLKGGSIAELFTHLLLNELGYKQECLYLNLEENSIKKGFDGYYSLGEEEWIMESKSGTITTKDISHEKKIKESYDDLKGKLLGKVTNNPWENAYNHADLKSVNTKESIKKNIEKYSDDFDEEKYQEIKNFNIIPASTIFLENDWDLINNTDLENKLSKVIDGLEYQKIILICITKDNIDLIFDYLNK